MADVNTGSNAILRMEVWITGTSAAGNYNNFHWRLSLIEKTGQTYGWASSVSASAECFWDAGGHTVMWSGNFGFDFRPGGQQSVVIAEGDLNGMGNFGDGSPRSFTFRGNIGNSGTSTVGGPTSVDQGIAGAATYVAPGTPTGVAATYVSDTAVTLNWTNQNGGMSNATAKTNQVYCSENNGAFNKILDITATNTASIGTAANKKYIYKVQAWNSGGFSAQSTNSNTIFTTPAAPSGGAAAKNAANDIVLTWANNVGYSEYTTEIWHGVVVGGVTTWDGAALTSVASGVTTYTHTAPNASQVHVYQLRAAAGTLKSAYNVTNSVQLLAPPNKPTFGSTPTYADKAVALPVTWVHNSVDTTPQASYEFSWSTDGGTTWSTSGKVASTVSSYTIPANRHAANQAVTIRVRTWGQATTGGSDGAGASPWADTKVITFKTVPTASITSPANGSVVTDATLRVTLGFSQPEAATFVKAEIELLQGASVLELLSTTNLVGNTMATKVQNGVAYSVRARVQDSNGLWSAKVTNAFTVTYLSPVPAVVVTSYLPDTGFGQLDLTIAAPGAGQSAVSTVTILRSIDGGPDETVVQGYPSAAALTFLDTTPTIHGTNHYTIITYSALGAQTTVTADLVTSECRRAYLSKGDGFGTVGVFGANLSVNEDLSVANATVEASGRVKPIGMYGVETTVQLKVSSFIFARDGFSTIDQLRALLLMPGKACYRDASGRRVFGTSKGSISRSKVDRGDLSFTMTETD